MSECLGQQNFGKWNVPVTLFKKANIFVDKDFIKSRNKRRSRRVLDDLLPKNYFKNSLVIKVATRLAKY